MERVGRNILNGRGLDVQNYIYMFHRSGATHGTLCYVMQMMQIPWNSVVVNEPVLLPLAERVSVSVIRLGVC